MKALATLTEKHFDNTDQDRGGRKKKKKRNKNTKQIPQTTPTNWDKNLKL